MDFFASLSEKERENYIKYLGIMGSLSRFFPKILRHILILEFAKTYFANV